MMGGVEQEVLENVMRIGVAGSLRTSAPIVVAIPDSPQTIAVIVRSRFFILEIARDFELISYLE